MSACINPLIIRLPSGIKDRYDVPFNQGIFDNDGTSDRLFLKVLPEDYNAAKPVNLEAKLGYAMPYTETEYNLYQLEAVDQDRRSAVKRYVLRDLIAAKGNLALYGVATGNNDCTPPLIALEDHHELDEYEDEQQGFTLRVGVLQVESLKGSYRETGTNYNYNRGCRIIFTHTHKIVSGTLEPYVPKI